MKKFSKFEIAAIKRTAQSVNPMVTKKHKIEERIKKLAEEHTYLENMQESYETAIRSMTGGYSTENLVEKVVEATGAVDKKGNPVKTTKYVLRYPDTIVPPEEEVSPSTDSADESDTQDSETSNEVTDTLKDDINTNIAQGLENALKAAHIEYSIDNSKAQEECQEDY